ncbi:MAG: zinc-dependent peptidase, partial [Gammaproteobacteria bacterium]|nr:zinc-dependent peptidase [Gammaproteobacteria bacterium]
LPADQKAEKRHLQQPVALLLRHRERLERAHGLGTTQPITLVVAPHACLPVLNLALEGYDGWVSVIVYPSGFAPERVIRDEYGVEHHVKSNLAGVAWHRGPVILAWDETSHAGVIDGHNLVIHEFAHKLDMQNGEANGFPPLHRGMDSKVWAGVFSAGFEDLQDKCNTGKDIGIDCYAASSPAEFFAVLSEVFFEKPDVLKRHYDEVYEQLRQYYRQDPLTRLESVEFNTW